MWFYLEMGLYRFNQNKMRLLGWALTQCDWCPYKKGWFGHRHAHREDDAKIYRGKTATWLDEGHLQAMECQRLPANSQSSKRQGSILPEAVRKSMVCQHLDCILPASRTVTVNVCCLKPPSFWYFVSEVLEK